MRKWCFCESLVCCFDDLDVDVMMEGVVIVGVLVGLDWCWYCVRVVYWLGG